MPLFEPSWNVAPSQMVPTITRNSPNKITMMKWGLKFGKNSNSGPINIRSESTMEKPFFKHFLTSKRCLIVADSFYEWGEVDLEGKEEKYPFNFYIAGRKLFGFAGIYNDVADAEGKVHYSCAILTITPNSLVKKVHNRMPVIIDREDEDYWLNSENKDFNNLHKLLISYPANKMKVNIVSRRVNSPKNDDKKLLEPINGKNFI